MDGLMDTQSHAFLLSTGRTDAGHGGGPGGHYTFRLSDTLGPIRYTFLGERA